MKKITLILVVLVTCYSVSAQNNYPDQKESGRKDVPKAITFITKVPLIKQIGNMKYIHDVYNDAFILFKGQDDTILTRLATYLDTVAMDVDAEGNESRLTPLGAFTMTPIAPFTLFSRQELREQSSADKKKLKELAQYKTYSITVPSYSFVEDLNDREYALLTKQPYVEKKEQTVAKVDPGKKEDQKKVETKPGEKKIVPTQRTQRRHSGLVNIN